MKKKTIHSNKKSENNIYCGKKDQCCTIHQNNNNFPKTRLVSKEKCMTSIRKSKKKKKEKIKCKRIPRMLNNDRNGTSSVI